MSQETDMVLRANKNARIIMSICEIYGISLPQAAEIFYDSDTSDMIEEGVADLQCRSDKYLATVVWEEMQEKKSK